MNKDVGEPKRDGSASPVLVSERGGEQENDLVGRGGNGSCSLQKLPARAMVPGVMK